MLKESQMHKNNKKYKIDYVMFNFMITNKLQTETSSSKAKSH
jgi:hypothetical protein